MTYPGKKPFWQLQKHEMSAKNMQEAEILLTIS
jgi:hypothetical protein